MKIVKEQIKDIEVNIKSIDIDVSLYKHEVYFIMPKEVSILENKHGWSSVDGCAAVTTPYPNKLLIRVYEYSDTVIVHEIVHAAMHILKEVGHNVTATENDEPLAYLIEYIYSEFKKGLKMYNKKK